MLRTECDFEELWNFLNRIGAIHCKHFCIQCPAGSGAKFNSYKEFFSLVLLAVCDARYCFNLTDIRQYGSNNDSGLLENSKLKKQFESGVVDLRPPRTVNSCSFNLLPYFWVGDKIFPLKTWMMKPCPGNLSEQQHVDNLGQSRPRRVIENTLRILASRCRIFNTLINASIENIERYVKSAILHHNYLCQTDNASFCPQGVADCEEMSIT